MTRLLLILAFILHLAVQAESRAAEADSEPVDRPDEQTSGQTETVDGDEEESAPAAENRRNRKLGDAFKNFRPSEEISADNAVAFPVDI